MSYRLTMAAFDMIYLDRTESISSSIAKVLKNLRCLPDELCDLIEKYAYETFYLTWKNSIYILSKDNTVTIYAVTDQLCLSAVDLRDINKNNIKEIVSFRNVEKIFRGVHSDVDTPNYLYEILLKLKDKTYAWIGDPYIYVFETDEEIIQYFWDRKSGYGSTALGVNNVYLLDTKEYFKESRITRIKFDRKLHHPIKPLTIHADFEEDTFGEDMKLIKTYKNLYKFFYHKKH